MTRDLTIKLYNSKTRKKEVFEPISQDDVRMYVCGPTVYDRAHIGNARPVIVFDVLYRLLREVYGAEHVTYVRNFTDVDDRINETAQNRKAAGAQGTLEDLIASRAEETIAWYHSDMDALGALRPNQEPRATEYIAQMIAMSEELIASGHAYAAEGHVLFAVDSYADYGKLSGRSVKDMIAGARVEVAPYKRNPMDFVIWKPSPDDLPGWDSPWGRGRPGWHIECSAMAYELLGAAFDIHGGGNDLTFPHHENEIAQSACAGHDFANVWMHNEMLQVEGKKMSKSLGNFFTVRDLLDQGVPGEVIRFVFLSTHYRKPMDWTEKKRVEAEKTLRDWRKVTSNVQPSEVSSSVLEKLAQDLDTYGAIDVLRKLAKKNEASELLASARLLGLLLPDSGNWAMPVSYSNDTGTKLDQVMEAWGNAVAAKDYQKADLLRAKLDEAAVILDKGLRVTDPLRFVRSLSASEKERFSVVVSDFVLEPGKYSGLVDQVMSARADRLLVEVQ